MGPVTASAALEHLYYQGAAGIHSSKGRLQSLMLSSGFTWVNLVDRRQAVECLALQDDFIEEPLNRLSLRVI